MKKFILGLIVGAVLAFTTSTYADDLKQLVGKAVDNEYPVILNGAELQNRAPSIGGTSYAPVREIATALGLEVDFKDDTVYLDKPKEVDTVEATSNEEVMTNEEQNTSNDEQIRFLNNKLRDTDAFIRGYQRDKEGLEILQNKSPSSNYSQAISGLDAKIAEYEAQKADLEAQLAELQAN